MHVLHDILYYTIRFKYITIRSTKNLSRNHKFNPYWYLDLTLYDIGFLLIVWSGAGSDSGGSGIPHHPKPNLALI